MDKTARPVLTATAALSALALVTAGRILLVDRLPDQGFFVKYSAIAGQILSGTIPFDRLGDLSVGYLWTIVLLQGPLGMDPLGIRTLQIIGVSLAAALCGIAAWRRWGPVAGISAAFFLLGSRAALVNATELEPETLILVLSSIGLPLLVAGDGTRSRFLAGLALGLAAVTRPSVLLPVTLVVLFLLAAEGKTKRFRGVVLLVLGIALPLGASRSGLASIGAGVTPMNPGTVLFEGWNPLATGYEGEAPAIVKDIEHRLGLPDGLHVAYRIVASRATGEPEDPAVSNRFWTERALAFVHRYPLPALRLALRKAFLGLHSYDAWDLATLHRKSDLLRSWPFIPFALTAAMSLVGLAVRSREPSVTVPMLWALGSCAVMVLFYVTARQRNVMLPGLALAAGVGIDHMVSAWRSGRRGRASLLLGFTLIFCWVFSIEGTAQREDRHGWLLLDAQEEMSRRARSASDPAERDRWTARAATFLDPASLRTSPAFRIEQEVRTLLFSEISPERRFDLALVLLEIGRPDEAENLLRSLDETGYSPRRGARWCSSTAYHLARCRLLRGDSEQARRLLRRAAIQSPGDPRILAMDAVLAELANDRESEKNAPASLTALFDPFTALMAMADSWNDAGQPKRAAVIGEEIVRRIPEWTAKQ